MIPALFTSIAFVIEDPRSPLVSSRALIVRPVFRALERYYYHRALDLLQSQQSSMIVQQQKSSNIYEWYEYPALRSSVGHVRVDNFHGWQTVPVTPPRGRALRAFSEKKKKNHDIQTVLQDAAVSRLKKRVLCETRLTISLTYGDQFCIETFFIPHYPSVPLKIPIQESKRNR